MKCILQSGGIPTVVNLTFNALGLNGGENNDNISVSGKYLTTIRFNQGVLTGGTNADMFGFILQLKLYDEALTAFWKFGIIIETAFKLQIMVIFEIFTKQTINFFNKSSINKNMLQKHISKRHINIDKKLFFS